MRRVILPRPSVCSAAALALLILCWPPAAHAGERVLVWPATPEVDTIAVEEALRAAGHTTVPFAPLRTELLAAAEGARTRDAARLEALQRSLEDARAAYLEQRWDDMRRGLEAAERDALAVIARPAHRELAWELSVQIGIAHLVAGDRPAAIERFILALTIDPGRAPSRELFGPAVASAHAEARAEQSTRTARPIALHLDPADARVTIDGTPLLTGARAARVRPGLHVIAASAPGFAPRAQLVRIDAAGPLRIELTAAGDSPMALLGPTWAGAGVDLTARTVAPAHLAAVRALAAERGAGVIIAVRPAGDTGPTARRITAADTAAAVTRERLTTAAVASLRGEPLPVLPPDTTDDPAWWTRWWFWTGASAIVVGAAATSLLLADQPTRYRFTVPR